MPFTAEQLQNAAAAALDYNVKGPALSQIMQARPLLAALKKTQKTFSGGKGNITAPVKGRYTTTIAGYTHDDAVTYQNPANIQRVAYPWKELHAGISMTLTELKIDGISVEDSTTGEKTVEHSDREMTVLTSILEDKIDDMNEGWARSFNSICWLDGTQDSKVFAGLLSFLPDTNSSGICGGIDRATNSWWRHRVLVGSSKVTASAANQTLTLALRKELRQLRRYSKSKERLAFCGAQFLDALELEIHSKGNYTLNGFNREGAIDLTMAEPELGGMKFVYDPTLDDLGLNKRCYVIDPKHVRLRVMEGEDMKTHNPARPFDRYVLYRAMTWTGCMTVDQLNCHGVYEVA